jgi:hypothetical protein
MSWDCNYRGSAFTVPDGDPSIANPEYDCRPSQPDFGDPTTWPTVELQPVISQGTATTGVGGLDPMAPGGPGLSRTWSEAVLAFLFGDESAAVDAPRSAMNATAPGCCAGDPEPHCLKCWLNRHRAWLLIVVLAVAAYLIKRKAAA